MLLSDNKIVIISGKNRKIKQLGYFTDTSR